LGRRYAKLKEHAMRTSQKTPGLIATIGIDLGKNTFHLVGFNKRGAIVLQQKVSRAQLERRLANIPRCLIGMEACSGSHHIGRQLSARGHEVRLIPAQYVKPFLKKDAASPSRLFGADRARSTARALRSARFGHPESINASTEPP
jgi:transposase